MKQREDDRTFELELHVEPSTTLSASKPMYRFYIDTNDGERVEWAGLTKKQARDMYAYTNAHQPHNVVRCGWEQVS